MRVGIFVLSWSICVFTTGVVGLSGQESATNAQALDQPYLVLATSNTGTLQRELSEAAARGYRFRSAWQTNEMLVLLERTDGVAGREIHLVAAMSVDALTQDLNEAASGGYRLIPGGMLRNPTQSSTGSGGIGREGVLLLERSPQVPERYEYRITTAPIEYELDKKTKRYRAKNYETIERLLQDSVANGYRLSGVLGTAMLNTRCGRGCAKLHAMFVWERQKGTTEGAPLVLGSTDYRFVEGYAGGELSERVGEAAADGYAMTSVSALLRLPDTNHVVFVMERVPESSVAPDYLVLSALDVEGLGNQLKAAGAEGFRGREWSFFGDPLVAVVERGSGDAWAYDYDVVETDRTSTLQRELLEAGATGRVIGATSSERRSYNVRDSEGIGSLFGSRPSFSISRQSASHIGFIERRLDERAPRPVAVVRHRRELSLEIGKKPSDFEKELNRAARDGFRLLSLGTAPDGETVEMTLVRESSDQAAEYRVLTTTREGTMQDELNDQSHEGFRLISGGVFAKPTKMGPIEMAAVMERRSGRESRHDYLLRTTVRESTLLDEISDAEAEGYSVVGLLDSGRGKAAFLERSAAQ